MCVIGKSSIRKPKNSAFIRYYLSNGSNVFRLVVWDSQWLKVCNELTMNAVRM